LGGPRGEDDKRRNRSAIAIQGRGGEVEMTTNQPSPEERIARSINAEHVPQIYFNAFLVGLTSGDVTIVLERNGNPVATLNASYTVAKTLAVKLGITMSDFEGKTGRSMLITDEVDIALKIEREG
jgi:hypothetical protein